MKALILDPALHSRGGHHFNAVERLQAELARLGITAPCLGSVAADATTRAQLACTPVFSNSVYGRTDFADDVDKTRRELGRALSRFGHAGLLILPCCDAVLAMALARRLRRRLIRRPVRVMLWLLYAPEEGRQENVVEAYAALAAQAEVRAFCETAAMAETWRDVLPSTIAQRIEILPGPGLQLRPRSHKAPTEAPVLSCIGFANRAKGYRLLPDAIPRVLERHAGVRFLVHGIVSGSDAEDEQPVFDRLSTMGSRVEVRQNVLSNDEYRAMLAVSNLLLLPYDPAVYRVRGSGVFSDSRAMGVPVLAPRGCAFAAPAFAEGSAVALEAWTPQGLAEAIVTALGRLDGLAERAAQAARHLDDALGRALAAGLAPAGCRAPGEPVAGPG